MIDLSTNYLMRSEKGAGIFASARSNVPARHGSSHDDGRGNSRSAVRSNALTGGVITIENHQSHYRLHYQHCLSLAVAKGCPLGRGETIVSGYELFLYHSDVSCHTRRQLFPGDPMEVYARAYKTYPGPKPVRNYHDIEPAAERSPGSDRRRDAELSHRSEVQHQQDGFLFQLSSSNAYSMGFTIMLFVLVLWFVAGGRMAMVPGGTDSM